MVAKYFKNEFSFLDIHFSKTLLSVVNEEDEVLGWLLCVLSFENQRGSGAIDIKKGFGIIDELDQQQIFEYQSLRQSLLTSGLCGDGQSTTPVVLDVHGYCYLHRYWQAQEFLVQQIVKRSCPPLESCAESRQSALAIAHQSGFTVITGGPGTGKTTLVSNIVASLLEKEPEVRVVVCAPTGKAAARLKQSIRDSKKGNSLSRHFLPEVISRIPDDVVTIHKLLAPLSSRASFRYHRDNLLPLDVLVVDEASMVDVQLMSHLLEAVPPRARVILVGDKYQLSSIESGRILADICIEENEPVISNKHVRGCIVTLTDSYRFSQDSGVGRLASAVNQGNSHEAVSLLMDDSTADVHYIDIRCPDSMAQMMELALSLYIPYWQTEDILEKLAYFERSRVLCAVNHGRFGVDRLNIDLLARLNGKNKNAPMKRDVFENRALLISRNDYRHMLFNGDTGVAWRDENDTVQVAFRDENDGVRSIPAVLLNEYQDALAMTIHKSQGSEFDHAVVVLPSQVIPLLSRELLYTAITRARKQLTVISTPEIIQYCIEHPTERSSSLRDRLWRTGDLYSQTNGALQ